MNPSQILDLWQSVIDRYLTESEFTELGDSFFLWKDSVEQSF